VPSDTLRKAIAEFVGAYTLIFAGAGAIVASSVYLRGTDANANLLVVALAHGLAIGVMVSATGHISGGHFNPAVTFGALVGRQISPGLAVVYWISQLLGGLSGALTLWGIFPATAWQPTHLGTPGLGPGVGVGTGILVEAVLTFFLVFVVYGAAIDPKGAFRSVGSLAIGLTITMDILMGGTLTGAAMNPARWFGTAVVANFFDNWYVYWIGPLLGGAVAGLVYGRILLERKR
jgi:MIP family channel proteins